MRQLPAEAPTERTRDISLPFRPNAEPIDLGTIKARLEKGGHYTTAELVRRDVERVFANAKKYNPPGSDVHIMASTLADRFR